MFDEDLIKEAGEKKLFPSKCMRVDSKEQPTKEQIEAYMRIAPGVGDHYRSKNTEYDQFGNPIN
jgi:hypothetical protein